MKTITFAVKKMNQQRCIDNIGASGVAGKSLPTPTPRESTAAANFFGVS